MANTLSIALSSQLKAYVDAQAAEHGTPAQYIRGLIVDDRDRRRNLEERLLDSLHNDEGALELTDEQWQHGDIVGMIEEHVKMPA